MAFTELGMTVQSAITGEPLRVTVEVARASIAVRIGDDVLLATRKRLTLDEARALSAQLATLTKES